MRIWPWWDANTPSSGTVTLTITADTSRFMDSIYDVRESMSKFDSQCAVARERRLAQEHLDAALRDLCTRLGLPPWETVIRPRLHADADAVAALMAQVRADALAAQGKPPRGRDGRFVGRAG